MLFYLFYAFLTIETGRNDLKSESQITKYDLINYFQEYYEYSGSIYGADYITSFFTVDIYPLRFENRKCVSVLFKLIEEIYLIYTLDLKSSLSNDDEKVTNHLLTVIKKDFS